MRLGPRRNLSELRKERGISQFAVRPGNTILNLLGRLALGPEVRIPMIRISAFAQFGLRPLSITALALFVSCSSENKPADPIQTYIVTPSVEETGALLQSDRFAELDQSFTAMQRAFGHRTATDVDLRAAFRAFYNPAPVLAPKYDLWVSTFPKSYVARLARGIYYTHLGDALRGKQLREQTPPERLKAADIAYGKAKEDLDASVALDSKPLLSYMHAMTMTGEYGDLAGSRHLLDRAISLDSDNYIARAKYMTVIETRWGGNHKMMQEFLVECHRARLSEVQMNLLESVIAEDQGWIDQFVNQNYAAAESEYEMSAALGGDKQLANLTDVLFKQQKYNQAIEPLTERVADNPNDFDLLATRGFAYLQSGRPREGINDLTAAAEGGSAYAQSELGRMYMIGIPGVLAPDFNSGLAWFRKSAAQGYDAGRQNLERALALLPPPQRGSH
jgi:tetratricopeptide (TPR) repeat protein